MVTLAVGVWDTHSDHFTYQRDNLPLLDRSLHALVTDLHERGLDKDVAVVVCGEMGRTPRINGKGGRDHWGGLAPLLLAGGGLKMGQVIGQSSRDAGTPATEPVKNKHLISTVMHTLFDVGKLRVTRGVSREMLTLTEHDPIPGLHG